MLKLHKRPELIKRLIHEDYPNATFLHIGPVGSGKTIFLMHILYERLKEGYKCVYVSVKNSPKTFMWIMKKRNMDVEPYVKDGRLIIVDYLSEKAGIPPDPSEWYSKVIRLKNPTPTEFSIMSSKLRESSIEFIFVDSLADIFMDFGFTETRKLLDVVIPRIREACIGAFVLDKGVLDEMTENYIRSRFDGIVEYKVEESPFGIERYIRMFRFTLAKIDTRWHKLIIDPYGIRIE
ncbi:MAG: RAD55 family ATPase [Thaumarchaeota archaeon]|jgi:KaiC/GvpD/RAD55 family RecA-like ATPase|nr:RAD55 family ATPase [Candidatus Terraquivivens yellowstonensis]